MTVTIGSRTYNFDNAPAFVRHAINLITERWGTDLSAAQAFIIHRANDLGRRFGTLG